MVLVFLRAFPAFQGWNPDNTFEMSWKLGGNVEETDGNPQAEMPTEYSRRAKM